MYASAALFENTGKVLDLAASLWARRASLSDCRGITDILEKVALFFCPRSVRFTDDVSRWTAPDFPEEQRKELTALELWKPANMKEFIRDYRNSKRRTWR